MNQSGDALGQPGESVDSLSDIAGLIDGDDAPEQEETLEELPDGEAGEVSEVDEEEEEESEDDSPEPAKKKFTIKHDGKDVELELTPEEEVRMLQQSFDYTQKTMAVAEERKAVQAERSQVQQVRQQTEHVLNEQLQRLQAYAQFMEADLGSPPPVEWAQQDVGYYVAEKERYEARKGQLQQAHEAIAHLHHEQARQRYADLMERAQNAERALRDTLPGWNDETRDALANYMGKHGLDPQTVAEAFVEKGLWELAHKARAYDELQARKATLKPKAELPKVTKPKASNQTPRGIVARQAAEKAYALKPTLENLARLQDL